MYLLILAVCNYSSLSLRLFYLWTVSGASVVMNCTFEKSIGSYKFGDYSFCMFLQNLFDDFNWSLGSGDTSTSGTGPSADHSGDG